jgi:hypothetical protein
MIHGLDAREVGICKYLISHGVYMTIGQLSFPSKPGYFRSVYTTSRDEAFVAIDRNAMIRDLLRMSSHIDEKINTRYMMEG